MDFAAGNGADASDNGWWAVERALSPSNISAQDTEGAGRGVINHARTLGLPQPCSPRDRVSLVGTPSGGRVSRSGGG